MQNNLQNEQYAEQEKERLPMKIGVTAYPVNDATGSLKGRATITLNDSFVITGVRVMDGKNGLFAAMPSQKDTNGKWHSVCYPTKEFGVIINDAVIGAYNFMLAEQAREQFQSQEYAPPNSAQSQEYAQSPQSQAQNYSQAQQSQQLQEYSESQQAQGYSEPQQAQRYSEPQEYLPPQSQQQQAQEFRESQEYAPQPQSYTPPEPGQEPTMSM